MIRPGLAQLRDAMCDGNWTANNAGATLSRLPAQAHAFATKIRSGFVRKPN